MGDRLVSVGLPVRNGADRVQQVVESVLTQDYPNVEIVISDNASTDETEEVGRALARADERVRYHRQSEDVGILRNFVSAMELARGEYFRWIGHDDTLAPTCLSSLQQVLADRVDLVLATSQIEYELDDGAVVSQAYDRTELASDDPVERFSEMLRLLDDDFALLDPIYALMRRDVVVRLPRRNYMHEDEVFAARLALLGPWGHVPQVLARRGWGYPGRRAVARRLGIPRWQATVSWELQVRELTRAIKEANLDPEQQRRARAAVSRLYVARQRRRVQRLGRRLRSRPAKATS